MKKTKKIIALTMVTLILLKSSAFAESPFTFDETIEEVKVDYNASFDELEIVDESYASSNEEQMYEEEAKEDVDEPYEINEEPTSKKESADNELEDKNQEKEMIDLEELRVKRVEHLGIFKDSPTKENLNAFLDVLFDERLVAIHFEEEELVNNQYGGSWENYFVGTGHIGTFSQVYDSFQSLLMSIRNRYRDNDRVKKIEKEYFEFFVLRVQDEHDIFREIVYDNVANFMFFNNFRDAFPLEAEFLLQRRPWVKTEEPIDLENSPAFQELIRLEREDQSLFIIKDEDIDFDSGNIVDEITPNPIGFVPSEDMFPPFAETPIVGGGGNDNNWAWEENPVVRERQTHLHLSYTHRGRRFNLLEVIPDEENITYDNAKALFRHISIRLRGQFIEDVDKFMVLINGNIYVFEDTEEKLRIESLNELLREHEIELLTREVVR